MKKSFGIHFFILILFLIILNMRKDIEYSIADIVFCLLVTIVSLLLLFRTQQKSSFKGYWLKPGNLLLLSLFIVNFQLNIDLIFGLRTFSSFIIPSITVRTCYISTLGVLATIAGLSLQTSLSGGNDSTKVISGNINLSFLVLLQVVVFIIWVATVGIQDLLSGSLYGKGGTDYWETLYGYILIVIMACICLNCHDGEVKTFKQFLRKNNIISWGCIGLYMLFRLVSGDRGPFIYTGALVLFAYIYCSKKRFRLFSIILVLFAGSIFVTLIGMARNDSMSGSFSQRLEHSYSELSYSERFGTQTLFAPTLELANSYRCNQYAVGEIEVYGRPLHKGVYQAFQIIGIVPFLSSYVVNNYNVPESMRSSGYYFTYLEKGDYYEWGQIGTTCIADFYMDFGVVGVLLGMLLLGLLFAWVDRVICLTKYVSPIPLMIVLTYASMCFYLGRSSVISQLKPLFGLLLIFYTNYFVFNKRNA